MVVFLQAKRNQYVLVNGPDDVDLRRPHRCRRKPVCDRRPGSVRPFSFAKERHRRQTFERPEDLAGRWPPDAWTEKLAMGEGPIDGRIRPRSPQTAARRKGADILPRLRL